MRRAIYSIIVILICAFSAEAQVGINTEPVDVSAVLEGSSITSGIRFPRMSTLDRNGITNPVRGLIIYNTDNNTIEYNTSSSLIPNWVTVDVKNTVTSYISQSAKYSNSDITTNINTAAGRNLPIFGTEVWNDNTALFTVSGTNLQVAETGRYKINVNVSLQSNSGAVRKAPEMYITVNNVQVGSNATTGYIRIEDGHEDSSLHLNEVLELNATDLVRVRIIRTAQGNTAIMRSAGSSDFSIEKLN
jgi:hypothetical protein